MTHFTEAREGVRNYFLTNVLMRQKILRACLIWDLQGKLRLLLQPMAGTDISALKAECASSLRPLAAPFWTEEVWIWSDQVTPSERAIYEKAWNDAIREGDTAPPEIRSLERHVSKDAWFARQTKPPWPLNENTPAILAFYSFKGGVGRTTALLSLAVQLARAGRRVAIADLDLEAPGIGTALPPDAERMPGCGIIDYLLERPLVGNSNDLDLADFYYTIDEPRIVKTGPPITVVPAGLVNDSYLEKLARLDFRRMDALMESNSDHAPIADLLKRLKRELNAEYILLDSRAGFHDLGGMALSGLAHLDVLFGLDSTQSWAGLKQVVRFLGRARIDRGEEQLICAVVHALAPEPASREAAVEQFKEQSYAVFSEDYYTEHDAESEDAWPLPDQEAEEQPHFPLVLGFDPLVQRYQTIDAVADRLADGDFRQLAQRILERLGRKLT